MSQKILIAPSILSADFARLGEEIQKVEKGGADWVHVDVMDGHFVPNLTVGPVVVKWIKKHTNIPQDVHLMIENPEKYVPEFAKMGAWSITVHWEACKDPAETVRLIKKNGCRAGMSVRPKTPIEKIEPVLADLDLVLVMTVEPGFGGQAFMPDMLPKVEWLKRKTRELNKNFWIEVDGGINADTAASTVKSGANVLVAGSAIFNAPDPGQAVKHLRETVAPAAA